jgi:hypothetical protein
MLACDSIVRHTGYSMLSVGNKTIISHAFFSLFLLN